MSFPCPSPLKLGQVLLLAFGLDFGVLEMARKGYSNEDVLNLPRQIELDLKSTLKPQSTRQRFLCIYEITRLNDHAFLANRYMPQ